MRVSDSALLSTHCSSSTVTPNNVRQLLVYYNFILPVLSVQHQYNFSVHFIWYVSQWSKCFIRIFVLLSLSLRSDCTDIIRTSLLLHLPGWAGISASGRGAIEFEIRYVFVSLRQSPKKPRP